MKLKELDTMLEKQRTICYKKDGNSITYHNKNMRLVEAHDRTIEPRKPVIRRCMNKLGEEQFVRLLDVKEADYAAQEQLYGDRLHKAEILQMMQEILIAQKYQEECFTLKDLAINGNDLIQLWYKPGKKIGTVLNQLLEMVIDDKIANDHKQLLIEAGGLLYDNS